MKKMRIDYLEYKGIVQNICRDISASGWQPDYVVGITRGGLTPAVMISQYFDIPCNTLKIQLRDGEECETNCWMAEDAFGYNGPLDEPAAKNILIVDDINDSGATLNWLMEDWQSSCLPSDARWQHTWGQNVKFAVIVDNLASKCNVKMDFVGYEINKAEEDIWVEFPYEEWWKK